MSTNDNFPAAQSGQPSCQVSAQVGFFQMPFPELCEIYTYYMTSIYTPYFLEALCEIYNERNEVNNLQLIIEG